MVFIRSAIFNLLFYGLTALACVLCLPGLLLPRKKALWIVYGFVYTVYFLEKYILGLTYEVKGREYVPEGQSCIIAAKHQSPYETLKLHVLFADPAIVLKRELLKIPLWGRFLAKTKPIAIDRSQGKEAMNQIIEGAKEIQKQDRPIVIFPQGTRVYTWQTVKDKPYRIGVARVYEETGMPIIPLALNTGMFWPRSSWVKHGGTVTFEFLPPIKPGKKAKEAIAELEQTLENESLRLQNEALERFPGLPSPVRPEEKAGAAGA